MSIHFNQTPVSQTSLINIPNSTAPSKPAIPLAPTAEEELLQTELNKLKNDVRKLQKAKKEDYKKESKPGIDTKGPGIYLDIKGPRINLDIKGPEISLGVRDQEMVFPDRMETATLMADLTTEPLKKE